MIRINLAFLLLLLTGAALAEPAEDVKPPAFIIGVWYQPASSFLVWKTRGVNTVIGYESESNRISMDAWTGSAATNGLFMIRQPHTNVDDDLKEPYLLAWMQADEPDVKNTEPEVLTANYAEWKKQAHKIPIFLNISGGNLLFQKTPRVVYEQYFKAADWIGNDFYPVTGWAQPTWLPRIGQAVDQCREISGGKPQFAFIETSNQQLAWLPKDVRGPSAGEVRAEIWNAVIHGAKGIVYFPQQFNPFKYDATPADISVQMSKQNRILTDLGPIIARPANPKGMKVSVKAPLEAAWRKDDKGAYVIVQNISDQPQKGQAIKLTGFPNGKAKLLNEDDRTLDIGNTGLIDDFGPFDVRVYKIGER